MPLVVASALTPPPVQQEHATSFHIASLNCNSDIIKLLYNVEIIVCRARGHPE